MTLSRSQVFALAHTITKRVIQQGDCYKTTFGAAMRMIAKVVTTAEKKATNVLSAAIQNKRAYSAWVWKKLALAAGDVARVESAKAAARQQVVNLVGRLLTEPRHNMQRIYEGQLIKAVACASVAYCGEDAMRAVVGLGFA